MEYNSTSSTSSSSAKDLSLETEGIHHSGLEAKRTRITNFTILLALGCCIGYSVIFLIFDYQPLKNIFLISTLYYAVVWYLHHKSHSLLAKISLHLGLLIQVSAMIVALGKNANASNFYIPISIVPFIIFSPSERKAMIATVLATVVNILLINIISPKFPTTGIVLNNQSYYLINYSIDVACIGCMITLAYLFLSLTEYGERMLSIQNNALEESAREQVRLNNLKDKILSIISHDIKHPLNNLQTITDLIIEERLTQEEAYTVLKNLKNSARSTSELLENLLNWSSGQLNNLTPSLQYLSLKLIAEKVAKQVEYRATAKNVEIKISIPIEHTVHADEQMLEIILRNLITNAIKFSTSGQCVEIKSLINNHMLSIEVIDQGIGIPDEIAKKLFQPDHSKSRYGTSNEKGFGLGLLICKQLADLHRGYISVNSVPGRETRFSLNLPTT